LHGDMLRRFWPVSYFSHAKPTKLQYKRRGGALSQHTPFEPLHLHFYTCTLFTF
jgi:hypothetical protein